MKNSLIFVKTFTMGQYYMPCMLKDKSNAVGGHLYSHQWDNGLKLMEHSYVGNNFVAAVESLLLPGQPWYRKRIVWSGDYGDMNRLYKGCVDANNHRDLVDEPIQRTLAKSIYRVSNYPYILNFTKRQFVDIRKVPVLDKGDHKWSVHPLPLLTCDGNGRGGGDYGLDNPYVGVWAKHRIGIANEVPKGFTEIVPNFEMDW